MIPQFMSLSAIKRLTAMNVLPNHCKYCKELIKFGDHCYCRKTPTGVEVWHYEDCLSKKLNCVEIEVK